MTSAAYDMQSYPAPIVAMVTTSYSKNNKLSGDCNTGREQDLRLCNEVYLDSRPTCSFVVVDIDPLELQIRSTAVGTIGVNTMLV
jgi:hypothetical protein